MLAVIDKPWVRISVAVICGLVAVGCYQAPDYGAARFRCDPDHPCPSDQICIAGHCDSGVGVTCGTTSCATGQTCCATASGASICQSSATACDGIAASCDGSEDCQGACCLQTGSFSFACGPSTCDMQLCHVDADCRQPGASKCCLADGSGQTWSFCAESCS